MKTTLIEITAFRKNPADDGVWFQDGRATLNPNFDCRCSTHRVCRTMKKARSLAYGILHRWPDTKVWVSRWGRNKKGERVVKDKVISWGRQRR